MECELPDFYSWSEPVARKEHHCCECDAPIEKGEKYFKASGCWDGDISTHKQHLLCVEACMFIRDTLNSGDCVCFGGLKEWCNEAMYQYCRNEQHPHWIALRSMLARIKKRERAQKVKAL